MTLVVDGKGLAKTLRAEVRERVLKLEGGPPGLAAVLVGDDPASKIYVRNKRRACERAGIRSFDFDLADTVSEADLIAEVERLNADPEVSGILVQLPLPDHIDSNRIALTVTPEKDADGLRPTNVGLLVAGRPSMVPGTPLGCMEILDRHGIEIEGKHAVVIGRSEIVGKPIALLLLHRHATVTLCHSRTRDLPDVVRSADILVAAVGRPRMIQGDWIREGAAVIDVGVNRLEDGTLAGDVDFDAANGRAGLLTPVPGGVGPLTIAMVLRNTVDAFERQRAGP
jgi:methylenetetrahydrofolate dehydrogenase (NADP+)/methenyltetrahydrofolate cyclohydrolase